MGRPARWDVALAADMCVDLILRGNVRPQFHQIEQLVDDYCLEIGGSANIVASQLVKLGATVGVLGVVGADPFGAFLLERLAGLGVDTACVRRHSSMKTGLGVALAEPQDRAILTYTGTIDALSPDDLPADPDRWCRHWHVASVFLLRRLRGAWPRFLETCRAVNVTTSLDPNWDPEGRWQEIDALLPLIDVFLPNDREAMAMTGEHEPLAAARRLSRLGTLVVVKCGAAGALAVHGTREWQLRPPEAVPAARIVDSVGAGDNFDAGFLRAWLDRRPVPECLALGHECAVASLAAAAGVAGQLRQSSTSHAGRTRTS